MLPLLSNERKTEPVVIKKANELVYFTFGDFQLLDVFNFLGRANSLASFQKAYKISETKVYFPYEGFDYPEKLNNTKLPPYETFFSKLRNNNPPEKYYSDLQSLIDGGLTSERTLTKLKLNQPSATPHGN